MRRAAIALDAVAVLAFVTIGRASHNHGETVPGVLSTLWPFAVGTVAGWALTRRADPLAPTTGVVQVVVTVAVGMVLRVLAGQGTAASFVAVALGFLGAWTVGGRWLARTGARRLRASSDRH